MTAPGNSALGLTEAVAETIKSLQNIHFEDTVKDALPLLEITASALKEQCYHIDDKLSLTSESCSSGQSTYLNLSNLLREDTVKLQEDIGSIFLLDNADYRHASLKINDSVRTLKIANKICRAAHDSISQHDKLIIEASEILTRRGDLKQKQEYVKSFLNFLLPKKYQTSSDRKLINTQFFEFMEQIISQCIFIDELMNDRTLFTWSCSNFFQGLQAHLNIILEDIYESLFMYTVKVICSNYHGANISNALSINNYNDDYISSSSTNLELEFDIVSILEDNSFKSEQVEKRNPPTTTTTYMLTDFLDNTANLYIANFRNGLLQLTRRPTYFLRCIKELARKRADFTTNYYNITFNLKGSGASKTLRKVKDILPELHRTLALELNIIKYIGPLIDLATISYNEIPTKDICSDIETDRFYEDILNSIPTNNEDISSITTSNLYLTEKDFLASKIATEDVICYLNIVLENTGKHLKNEIFFNGIKSLISINNINDEDSISFSNSLRCSQILFDVLQLIDFYSIFVFNNLIKKLDYNNNLYCRGYSLLYEKNTKNVIPFTISIIFKEIHDEIKKNLENEWYQWNPLNHLNNLSLIEEKNKHVFSPIIHEIFHTCNMWIDAVQVFQNGESKESIDDNSPEVFPICVDPSEISLLIFNFVEFYLSPCLSICTKNIQEISKNNDYSINILALNSYGMLQQMANNCLTKLNNSNASNLILQKIEIFKNFDKTIKNYMVKYMEKYSKNYIQNLPAKNFVNLCKHKGSTIDSYNKIYVKAALSELFSLLLNEENLFNKLKQEITVFATREMIKTNIATNILTSYEILYNAVSYQNELRPLTDLKSIIESW